MSTLARKKANKINNFFQKSIDYEKLGRIAQKIEPFHGFASHLKITVEEFRRWILHKESIFIRETILEGEYIRYAREQREYYNYLNAYSYGENLKKKDKEGNTENLRVTQSIMMMRAGHWANFQKLYEKNSLDHYLQKVAEKKQAEKEGNTDSYLELKQELAEHADKLAGISGRKHGDLSARPEHLLIPEILKKKASVKTTDKKKPSFKKQKLITYAPPKLLEYKKPARKTSKILWLPENPPKKIKKIVLTDFINNNNNCFFIKPRRKK